MLQKVSIFHKIQQKAVLSNLFCVSIQEAMKFDWSIVSLNIVDLVR